MTHVTISPPLLLVLIPVTPENGTGPANRGIFCNMISVLFCSQSRIFLQFTDLQSFYIGLFWGLLCSAMKLQVPSVLLCHGKLGYCFKAGSPVAVLGSLTIYPSPYTNCLPASFYGEGLNSHQWHTTDKDFSPWSSPASWTGVSFGLIEK